MRGQGAPSRQQPLDLLELYLELKAELLSFLGGEPPRHLRKDDGMTCSKLAR
jgi:hypothetical protein